MLQIALKYIDSGWSIIPLVPKSKNPLIKTWLPYQNKRMTKEEASEIWQKHPNANIAIITGKISGFTVVDIDPKNGGEVTGLPMTTIVKTGGGGWHYYYRYTDKIATAVNIKPGIDIRNNGAYVVAPGSTHPNGRIYEWSYVDEITQFPIDFFSGGIKPPIDWEKLTSGVSEGSRDMSAAQLIGKLTRNCDPALWESIVWPQVMAWNVRNTPPLSLDQLRKVYDSIMPRSLASNYPTPQQKKEEVKQKISEDLKGISFLPFSDVLEMGHCELINTKPEDVISFGYDCLDEKLTGIFPGELIVVGGESGCLHADTPIFDPVDKTTLSVKKRCEKGLDFNVYSLDDKNNVVIAKAEIPKKYFKTKMYELSNGKDKIIVTGKHRVFDGVSYTEAQEILNRKGASTLLPTILDDVSTNLLGVLHCPFVPWNAEEKGSDVYYDFHVPKYENYYACGLFHHNSGKTFFATNIIYRASKKYKCAIYALEDRLEDYAKKALYFGVNRVARKYGGQALKYSWNDFIKNDIKSEEYRKHLKEAKDGLCNENIFFAKADVMMNIDLLEALIEKQCQQGIALFLIDHLHYFDLFSKLKSKADYIEEIMVRIKSLQRRTGARIILVVHYRKLNGKKPNLDSFKDSISIVQNANYVINIWRERELEEAMKDKGNKPKKTFFYIPKSRNPNGESIVDMEFDPVIGDYIEKNQTPPDMPKPYKEPLDEDEPISEEGIQSTIKDFNGKEVTDDIFKTISI